MKKRRRSIVAVASLATMISLAAPAVANAATDTTDANTVADSNTESTKIYVPWYATTNKDEQAAMTKTVKQTIKYIDKDTGKQMTKLTKDNVQILTFHRQEQWDTSTGQPTGVYTDWDGPKSTKAVDSYEYIGYTASKKVVPAHKYSVDDSNKVIKVYYTQNPKKKSTQKRTVTRTIKIYRPKKGVKKVVQKAHIKRTVYTDTKDHFKTYGKWSNATWKAYKAPKFKGYTAKPKIVKKEKVAKTVKNKHGMVIKINNKTVKITYKKNK